MIHHNSSNISTSNDASLNNIIFESLPCYGMILDSNGAILSITNDLKVLLNIELDSSNNNLFTLFENIGTANDFKNVTSSSNLEITYPLTLNKKISLQFTFKELIVNNELMVYAWIKDKTKSRKHDKVKKILANLAKSEIQIKDIKQYYNSVQDELNKVLDASNFFVI